ncbi:ferrochelatase [Fodinisporobacter ferrooxydans]|uniref:Coproporphyrin III ferrochelatase n=1 Tax=Fodinisporobacter ferrooxydans TaxID=2901836 RepID=A0ABY4CP09_9BACL|nr:ferrochelatase [Alicyclobacillaceae bacterium MYW30-H2]
MNKTVGILVMAYGTPQSLDHVEAYYTHIRRGRKPTPELLRDLIDRYKAIGGVSPLNEITRMQSQGLETLLNANANNNRTYRVYLGMKHCSPFIQDAIEDMHRDGIEEAVGFVLAPHYSVMSIGTYIQAAEEALQKSDGLHMTFIRSWHLHPDYLQAAARRIQDSLEKFPKQVQKDIRVVFSAHSLPEKILSMGDPYPRQIHETGDALARELKLNHWLYAWQSAGRTADPWLGPDILDVLKSLRKEGHTSVISCPIGFVSDHLEVLYDIDIECQALCKEIGIHLIRTASLNADPDFLKALANIVVEHLAGESA